MMRRKVPSVVAAAHPSPAFSAEIAGNCCRAGHRILETSAIHHHNPALQRMLWKIAETSAKNRPFETFFCGWVRIQRSKQVSLQHNPGYGSIRAVNTPVCCAAAVGTGKISDGGNVRRRRRF
jgi:hypothetical protein